MKTFKDIAQALLNGKKIRIKGWNNGLYYYLVDENLQDERGFYMSSLYFSKHIEYEIYEASKPKQQV